MPRYARYAACFIFIAILIFVPPVDAQIFNAKDALVRATRFGKLVEGFRSRLSEFLWYTFGRGTTKARVTPVALGVAVDDDTFRTLITNNTALPVKMSHVFSGSCRDMEDTLELAVFVNPNLDNFKLGGVKVVCEPGGPGDVRIQQTLDLDKDGRLIFSLEDLTGRYPAHTLQQDFPSYPKLAGLFAPFQDLLYEANSAVSQLQIEFEASQTVASDLHHTLSDQEKQMESTNRELWACMRDANHSDLLIKKTAEKLDKEKKAREAQTAAFKKAKAESETIVVNAKGALHRKETEVAELGSRVKELKGKIKALGKEAAQEKRYLEDQKLATEEILLVKTRELEDKREEAKWWSGVAGVVSCVFALVVLYVLAVLWKRSQENMDESSVEGSAKRERRKLLRLLTRVRQAKEPSEPTKATQEDDTDSVDASLVPKLVKDQDDAASDIFPSSLVAAKCGSDDARRIRIQCPGVAEADVTVTVLFNGVEVSIDRKRTPGLDSLKWKRSFVFPVEDGNFVFKDAETRLDRGVLELVCVARKVEPRIFRFPEHFDMAYADFEPATE